MSGSSSSSSSDKLLLAAIDLIADRGYKCVTTKEIAAAAGLSEMTLFRHFGSKQNLLESAFDRFHYAGEMQKLFAEKLVWELETDLLLISRTYHDIMNRNRKMLQISLKESGSLPGFREKTQRHPRQLKEFLTDYFVKMAERGKMISTNPELQAVSFMWMNYGAFMNNRDGWGEGTFAEIPLDDFIRESVKVFTKALAP
ncbi:TetR/AcrR family transcriptional regulator [Paenibacillus sp. GbtcB18]|uniref:TetR/AcrR family transcriptional regulator n=1 Tax=Paenibacillus sp. GbtcB18 TaxID=2824763 RepID=UPI001C2F1CDD|nr:TetR/AcrR family transcriptional regulator [Paenibacillus sp. GbtcB18]